VLPMSLSLSPASNSKVTDAIMPYLRDPRLVRKLAYINGKWVHGNRDMAWATLPGNTEI
jgi:aspartate-semialdehyde dehydrogenase